MVMEPTGIEAKIAEYTKKIVDHIHPQKVVLFGSYVWGTPHKDSDLDFFVVKETDNTRKTAMAIQHVLIPRTVAVDVVVYSPEQVERRERLGDLFLRKILSQGRILYAT